MSEEIINQSAMVAKAKRETNNNVNKDDTSTYGSLSPKDTTFDYDEIGEEFEFSDNNSQEENETFQDCDSDMRRNSNADNNDGDRLIETTIHMGTTTTTTTTITGAIECTNNLRDTTDGERETRQLSTDQHSGVPVEKPADDVIVEEVSKTEKKTNSENKSTQPPPATIDTEDDDDGDCYSDEPEDELIVQFLGEANRIAEARLTARRQARAEAREIRMKELERQRKDQENNADRDFDMHTTPALDPSSRARSGGNANVNGLLNSSRKSSMSSQQSREDTVEDEKRSNIHDNRQELKDAEERFRKVMIANAQLDNERAAQTYEIQHLKDQLEEFEELNAQLQRELKDKTSVCNAFKRNLDRVTEELKLVQGQLNERDALIADQGLIIVAVENNDGTDAKRALITAENAQLLSSVQGSLDVRLKRFNEEKQQLKDEVQRLREQLESYKSKDNEQNNNKIRDQADEETEAQREANKIICDYKFRLQKAEQDITSLQTSLARSETQLARYKSAVEAAEKAEAELKGEKRKLQRENREISERLEEQETTNKHLIKRLDKIKNAKSALLKDL